MRYFESQKDGYILGVGKGLFGTEIDVSRYNAVLAALPLKPPATETTDYRLKVDLTWEEYDVPPMPEPEPDDHDKAEAYDILMGVAE